MGREVFPHRGGQLQAHRRRRAALHPRHHLAEAERRTTALSDVSLDRDVVARDPLLRALDTGEDPLAAELELPELRRNLPEPLELARELVALRQDLRRWCPDHAAAGAGRLADGQLQLEVRDGDLLLAVGSAAVRRIVRQQLELRNMARGEMPRPRVELEDVLDRLLAGR